jgi:hypothetical protein
MIMRPPQQGRRAVVCRGADGNGRIVRFGRRIDLRQWCSNQLFGVRDIGLTGGAGEQSVMADAMKAFW